MSSVLSASQIREYLTLSPPLLEGLPDPEIQIQPNGVDFSLHSVRKFLTGGRLGFSDGDRILSDLADIEFEGGWVELAPGSYLVMFNEIVHLPLNIMALAEPRSSLLRI